MAFFDTVWYVNSVGWSAVTAWSAGAAITAGTLRRQTAPAVGSERVFVCIVGGNTHATTEPTWVITRGAKTTDNTVTWQECTGVAPVNGDLASTAASSAVRSQVITLGAIIKNNAETHYFICTTSGTAGAGEPSYSTSLGNTTNDNTVVWTCIGAVGAFSGGAAPFARLETCITLSYANGANNKVFIGHNHAQTAAAAVTISSGQPTTPLVVICHNAAGNYPPQSGDVTTGATITTTGANAITIGGNSCVYVGVTFQAGSGAVAQGIAFGLDLGGKCTLINCSLQKLGTSGSNSAIDFTTVSNHEWINTTVKFGAVTDVMRVRLARLLWRDVPGGVLASGSAVPTVLATLNLTGGGSLLMHWEGLDLSQFGSGKTLVLIASGGGWASMGPVVIKDCKIDAAVTKVSLSGSVPASGPVDIARVDSAATSYISERHSFWGSQTTEVAIVRTGGAVGGSVPVAAKVVTTASARWDMPFEMIPIAKHNSVTGSAVTATVEGIWGGGAVPNNDDIWLEVAYMGSSGSPLSSRVSGTKANRQAAASALASSAETWGGSTTAFKMSVTFTPEIEGLIYAYVRVGKASSTFYVDPMVTLS